MTNSDDRLALVQMLFYEGKNPREIAADLGLPEAAVHKDLKRLHPAYTHLVNETPAHTPDQTPAPTTLETLETRLTALETNAHTHTPIETAGPAQPTP